MTNPLRRLPKIAWPGTAEAMIAAISSQIGYTESGNNDTFFGRWYGMNNAPWCAMVVSWAAFVSGNSKNVPKHAFTPAGADWFQDRDQWGEKPKVGAIVYYDTSGMGRISHTGVVDEVFPDGSWTSVEGNTNAAGSREGRVVRRQKRRTVGTSRGGFGYPKYTRIPTETKRVVPVDLSNVIAKAKKHDLYDGRVAKALKKEGFGANRKGYASWQRTEAGGDYRGNDADGIAGRRSLTALGKRHGWSVKA